MILHINSNYIYSSLHALMMEDMPDPQDHIVFVPMVKNPAYTVWDSDKAAKYPKVIRKACFSSWDRFFYSHKRKKIYQALKESLDLRDIKLVHAYTLFTDGDIAYKIKKEFNIPYIVVLRNSDVNTFFKRIFHLREHGLKIMREAELIFFLSEGYRDHVIGERVPEELREEFMKKSRVAPNGISNFWHDNPPPKSLLDEKKSGKKDFIRLLYVGLVNFNKNIEATQKARAILGRKGIESRLDIVGRVKSKMLYKKIMNYPDSYYHPPKKEAELIDYYRQADIFVMPSRTESFGLVYAEAMSQGLPVIYTKNEGFDSQFPDGQVGYAVDPDSPEEIALAIEKIIKDPGIADRALKGAGRFKWELINRQYVEIYKTLINKD